MDPMPLPPVEQAPRCVVGSPTLAFSSWRTVASWYAVRGQHVRASDEKTVSVTHGHLVIRSLYHLTIRIHTTQRRGSNTHKHKNFDFPPKLRETRECRPLSRERIDNRREKCVCGVARFLEIVRER